MSPVRATALCGRIGMPPFQGSSGEHRATQGFTLGYELKVSPSGLRVERMEQACRGYELKVSPSGLRAERLWRPHGRAYILIARSLMIGCPLRT